MAMVPSEVKTANMVAGPIYGGFVIILQVMKKMVNIFYVIILDAKIINTKAEVYFLMMVPP